MTIRYKETAWHKKKLGYWPDLENPVSYNDKINWLKVFDQDKDQIICCDKLAVKDFVAKEYGPEIIIPNTTDYPEVLKTNNGSGDIEFVNNLQEEKVALERLKFKLKKKHGKNKGEWAYSLIEPKIVREKRIDYADVDYKFHCCNGEVKWLQMIWDRYSGGLKASQIDPDGKPMDWKFDALHKHHKTEPKCGLDGFFQMKKVAETLSKRWKYVRVDLYWGENQPWFGELTFWPRAGCYKGDDQIKFGALLDFDITTTKPKVVE